MILHPSLLASKVISLITNFQTKFCILIKAIQLVDQFFRGVEEQARFAILDNIAIRLKVLINTCNATRCIFQELDIGSALVVLRGKKGSDANINRAKEIKVRFDGSEGFEMKARGIKVEELHCKLIGHDCKVSIRVGIEPILQIGCNMVEICKVTRGTSPTNGEGPFNNIR